MAIILMEEVLMGLDEVKESIDQAVIILENLIDDLSPALRDDLDEVLEKELLHPLQSRRAVLNSLLINLAETAEQN